VRLNRLIQSFIIQTDNYKCIHKAKTTLGGLLKTAAWVLSVQIKGTSSCEKTSNSVDKEDDPPMLHSRTAAPSALTQCVQNSSFQNIDLASTQMLSSQSPKKHPLSTDQPLPQII
jgi:hypothetical protein